MTESPTRILVVDDQPGVRAVICLALKTGGYDVVGVDGATAAIQEFEKSHFDVAIIDIFMPGMDGAKLIKVLRGRSPDLPVIAISGVPLKASGRSALDFLAKAPQLGKIVCLQKPFRSPALLQAVGEALGTKRLDADPTLPAEIPS
jgi:CheY-like chemotaxis protein